MSINQQQLLISVQEVEECAEDVLSTKQEIVDLDRKRNANREAIRALEKKEKEHYKGSESKSWLAMGNTFFKLPTGRAMEMMKNDQVKLNSAVNTLRSDLKVKVNSLREKEGKAELKGFGLKSLGQEEMSDIHKVIRGSQGPMPMFTPNSLPN